MSPLRWRPRAPRSGNGDASRSRSAPDYCLAAVDAMLAMGDEIPAELAWQMGRPVRYGAGELRGFAERARYMIDIAEDAPGADRSWPEGKVQALDRARTARTS